jgi:hypothetical protein
MDRDLAETGIGPTLKSDVILPWHNHIVGMRSENKLMGAIPADRIASVLVGRLFGPARNAVGRTHTVPFDLAQRASV